MFEKLKREFDKNTPDILYALIMSIYWRIHPSRRNILILPIRNLWLISYEGCKFFVPKLKEGIDWLAPFEPYDRCFKIKSGDVVVDVGACIGGFAIPAAKKVCEGIIVAIEPDPENVKRLRANVWLNKLHNIEIVPKAAWNCKGIMTLYRGKSADSHSLIPHVKVGSRFIMHPSSGSKIVSADTLSHIISDLEIKKIDFLKIDVEGAEVEVLEGLKSVLMKTEKVVVGAYHVRNGEKTLSWVRRFLEIHGFQVYVGSGNLVYAQRKQRKGSLLAK